MQSPNSGKLCWHRLGEVAEASVVLRGKQAAPRPGVYLDASMMLNIKDRPMRGLKFVVDDDGGKRAVLIDLDEHGELWEDFYDTWLASECEQEPRESLEVVRGKLGLESG